MYIVWNLTMQEPAKYGIFHFQHVDACNKSHYIPHSRPTQNSWKGMDIVSIM